MRFDFTNPYSTTRLPVFARNVVSTSHPLAAQAGLRMLWKGGSAVDAAIAAAAAMTICEPVSNGLGSDAFAIVWDGSSLHGLNAAGPAPAAWSPDYFGRKHGHGAAPPKRGVDSVTVPGAVGAWSALSERFGRLPFADLLEPAVEIAERGYLVPTVVQQKWAAATPELRALPGFAQSFLQRGRAPAVGELFRFPAAANALRRIAESRGAAFYEGEIAQAVTHFIRAHGGAMSDSDLANYRPQWVTPLQRDYRGYTLHEIPPSGQGIAALIALGILERFDMGRLPVDGPDSQHLQIEAIKLAFADVHRYVADPAAMDVSPEQLLDDRYLAGRANTIDMRRAQAFAPGNPVKGGTIYLTAADENGMMVSFIQSNYMGFGSGCVEPEFGISLQNRGHGFSLQPGPNQVAPGKRPFHTIIPGFLTKDGAPVMSFGVMGGNMQPQGHVQTLVRMLDHRQNPQAACDAPRWRFNQGLEINVEQQMDRPTVQALRDRGHAVEVIRDSYQDFGAGQFIWRGTRRWKATWRLRIRAGTGWLRGSDLPASGSGRVHHGTGGPQAGEAFAVHGALRDDGVVRPALNGRQVHQRASHVAVAGVHGHDISALRGLRDFPDHMSGNAARIEVHGAVAIGVIGRLRGCLLVLAPDPESERLAAGGRESDPAEDHLLGIVRRRHRRGCGRQNHGQRAHKGRPRCPVVLLGHLRLLPHGSLPSGPGVRRGDAYTAGPRILFRAAPSRMTATQRGTRPLSL
jgi:gamma-glutamyltranspeptidase/glutathione hydrolase